MKLVNGSKSVLLSVFLLCYAGALYSQKLAFPTAEGYGKYAVGGRGGKVIEVTNLNSSGQGSFAAAVAASGPRTVVFRVSGTIDADVTISNDYITIAGQTAPGDGITLKGSLGISASEVIVRYIRVRTDGSGDALGGRYEKNIILDHVSTSWGRDEVLSIYHCEYVTIQWCMITENCQSDHNFAAIWGSEYSTYHHNLIAHNKSRNPRWASGCGSNDYRNNVLYNWGYNSCYGAEAHQSGDRRDPPIEYSHINMVANYYKPGPGTESGVKSRIADPSTRNGDADAGQWWVSDNYVEGSPEVTADNWLGVTKTTDAFRLDEPWPAMEINQQSAEDAYESVLDHVGCSFPKRDSIDVRIIEEVSTGTATKGTNGFVSSPADAGGWPILESEPAPDDTDHDGMPDDWETANGLNPNDPEDRNEVGEGGYTNLEIYLNSMVSYPTAVKESAGLVPAEFTLEQNYPNPFNPTTQIQYTLAKNTNVEIAVYDLLGHKVTTLVDAYQNTGSHKVVWDASGVSAGVYLYQMKVENQIFTKKMILLK